jgi:ribosomal protein S8
MSLVNLAHVCSHLQNASKARLGLTSIPMSNLHLSLSLSLQKQGFVSTVQVAGPSPPPLDPFRNPSPEWREQLEEQLKEEPWLAFSYNEAHHIRRKGASGEHEDRYPDYVPSNPAKRRIWLGLKYWNNEPVMRQLSLISKPTRRIWMGREDIGTLVRGRKAGYVKGITKPGECIFVSTDKGIFESRECVERTLGGQLLCRVV